MNRRRTVPRQHSLLRCFSSPRNRRVRPKAESTPRQPLDWRALLRGAGRGALLALKVVALLIVLAGLGFGGYYGYRRAMASTYFCVKTIEVRGARRASADEVTRLGESAQGRNIFTVDLRELDRLAAGQPWVKSARTRRELPDRLVVDVTERRASALLHLGYLYLVDEDGQVFTRPAVDEAEGLPTITGLDRTEYLDDPEGARQRVMRALGVMARYYAQARPALSEVHLGVRDELTLYLRRGGVAVKLGSEPSDERLSRFDAVWAALGPETSRARVVFLDDEIRADRVTVRMGSNE